MWTSKNRIRYDRSKLRYPSDLTDAEWKLIEPLIPPGKPGGDKRTVIMREVVNGLMYVLSSTIRRECLDHMIVFGEAHLRWILGRYAAYYNESRIHRSLDKDAPFHREIEHLGVITSQPVLGGLHHQYCRI